MNTLSKTQVLALFLGATSAQTVLDALNGGSSFDTVPEGQGIYKASSGTACTSNAECTAAGEKCANLQLVGSDAVNLCINGNYCGSIGRVAGNAFAAECWVTPDEGTETEPAAVDAAAYVTAVEGLITKDGENWDGANDIFVSSRFNYQDGWWIKGDDDLWTETDKPQNNTCFISDQCEADECCGLYPDSNNRQCFPKSEHGQTLTVGPMSFIPNCTDIDLSDIIPENAADDIAAGVLAEASEKVNSFRADQLADAKTAAGYDDMTDEQKTAFDEEQAANDLARDEFVATLKTTAGYDTDACDDTCKALFEEELHKWERRKYETCKADSKGIACRKADEIKTDEETQRAAGDKNYYSGMTDDERLTYEFKREDEVKALESTLTAAFIVDSRATEGAGRICGPTSYDGVVGSSVATAVLNSLFAAPDALGCDTAAGECCGIATPVQGAFVNDRLVMCNTRGTGITYENDLGQVYNFECQNAIKLATSVAAAAVASLYM